MEEIEKRRKELGLTKAEVARRLGCPTAQNYNNWCYRDSLPKEYYDAARRFIARYESDLTDRETTLITVFRELSDEDQAAIIRIVRRVNDVRS